MADGSGSYTCARLCDIIHSEGAHVYATYGDAERSAEDIAMHAIHARRSSRA